MSYIHRQPVTEEEIALAQEALEGCPSESIGSDGACDHRKRHRARQIVFSDSTQ